MDVAVEGKAFLETGLTNCCIGITDGKIVKIAKTITHADKRFRFLKKLILPAGVDLHVHFRDPGMTNKEDFTAGSMAAAAGGTSMVLDMPNTRPPTRTAEDIDEKIAIASKKSFVDFGLVALLNENTDMEKVTSRCAAFKIYLGETTGGLGIEPKQFPDILQKAASTMRPIIVHAEHLEPLREMVEKDLADHNRRRSEQLEFEAARFVCNNVQPGIKILLAHVTQANILGMARSAGVMSEITPHHLLLSTSSKLGARGKINPAIRSRSTQFDLWKAFASSLADTVGSDHSPHTIEEKNDDFDAVPSGFPGVETRLPLLLQKVSDRKLDLSVLVNCCSTRPAEIIDMKKGKIAVGFDADLIAVDLRASKKIRADKLHSKCGWTPYERMRGIFPYSTIIRGIEVAREGEIVGERIGRLGITDDS